MLALVTLPQYYEPAGKYLDGVLEFLYQQIISSYWVGFV